MRPIDADEFVELMSNKSQQVWKQTLDATPTLEWGKECEMVYTGLFDRWGICSNCGEYTLRRNERQYCPHCGARIIKEDEWF